jgi:hypothetical protein
MKLEFMPGKLTLFEGEPGSFVLVVDGESVYQTRSVKRAIAKFNEIRREMEARFPAQKQSAADQAENTLRLLADSLVGPYSKREPKRTNAKGTRTFGG